MSATDRVDPSWSKVAVSLLVGASGYPIEYAKVLVQLGHEPLPPRPTRTIFGKPALALPNIFQYIGHIKRTDGFCGCYRGVLVKLSCSFLCDTVYGVVIKEIKFEGEHETRDDEELSREEKRTRAIRLTLKDIIGRTVALIISHPLHVLTIRTIAQFVGGQETYVGVLSSAAAVYRESGMSGFFSGLVPRILGEVICSVTAGSLTFLVNTYLLEDKELHTCSLATMKFIVSVITYPFQVVTNCMAVTGTGLAAGRQPHMPVYVSWVDCWSHLSKTRQLKRGGSLLWRYYTGPQIVVGNQISAASAGMFKSPTSF